MKKRSDGRFAKSVVLDGKRRWFYGNSKREAERKMRDFLRHREDVQSKGESFRAVAEEWLGTVDGRLSPTTSISYHTITNRFIGRFGNTGLKEITAKQIKDFIESLGYKKKTAKNQLSVLRLIFEYGILNYGLESNPCDHISLAGGGSSKRRALTEEETETVKKSVGIAGGLLAYTLLYTGLRRGEALALQYGDIDREHNLIHITKSVYYTGDKARFKQPKTEAGVRDVLLLPQLASRLPVGNAEAYIFSTDGREPYTKSQIERLWDRYRAETGLTISTHYLRHNYATLLYSHGVDIKSAQYLLGHANVQTTMNIYTHLANRWQDSVWEKLKDF